MANRRFNVSMSEELLDLLDAHCKQMAISRNGFINFIVAQNLQMQKQMIDQLLSGHLKELIEKNVDNSEK